MDEPSPYMRLVDLCTTCGGWAEEKEAKEVCSLESHQGEEGYERLVGLCNHNMNTDDDDKPFEEVDKTCGRKY